MSIFPNPVASEAILTIDSEVDIKNLTLTVFSANGQLLSSKVVSFQKNVPLDFTGYPTGIYYVKAQSIEYQGVLKIVKE